MFGPKIPDSVSVNTDGNVSLIRSSGFTLQMLNLSLVVCRCAASSIVLMNKHTRVFSLLLS